MDKLQANGIKCERKLITPEMLKKHFPLAAQFASQIEKSRQTIRNILTRRDPRLLVICGPCSIHDLNSALEYATNLKSLADKLHNELYIVMRVYFEKPRTTMGWKGFINDPRLDKSYDMTHGLYLARSLLIKLAALNLPVATETLTLAAPYYLSDLISWTAIGARTCESQLHRELASSLPMPIGFKNGTDGNINIAINAMKSAAMAHHFIGMNHQGEPCIIESTGNPNSHLILRGGIKPNYNADCITRIEQQLQHAGFTANLMIDCSHGNCNKNYLKQMQVIQSITEQLQNGNKSIIGIMLESHLNAGNQAAYLSPNDSKYGISITDGCIGWKETEKALIALAKNSRHALLKRHPVNTLNAI